MVVPVVPIGNSRGIRFPKFILDKFSIKDKVDMEFTENGILITPVQESPRSGWVDAFCKMHENNEDKLEDIPDSGDFEWEW